MCGIAGIFGLQGLDAPATIVTRMADALAHRGPDAMGSWVGGSVALGHRRLSIIDLSAASNQPFRGTDGRYTMIYNGEIYNYRELRKELEAQGAVFRTASDTEVLMDAYERWGPACLHKLHGMFAFAIHDARTDEMFLARDRMGVKPLYFHRDGGRVVFASEVRALLASGLVPRKLDHDALVDHLRYQTVHAPATLLKDVYMLQAGHWMRLRKDELRIERWYDLVGSVDHAAASMPLPSIHKEVRERLSRAVERRLVSDVPFGAFLSGGIDSSAVVALMAQASSRPVHTFSVVFDESEFSEERYARIVADRYRTEHTAIRLRPEDMLRMLPDALAAMDHPSADGPNTYVVSKVTKAAGITMALSGLGGDEVFAGYPVFARTHALYRKRWLAGMPRALRGLAASVNARLRPSITSDKLGELLQLPSFGVEETYPVSRLSFSDRELLTMIQRNVLPANSVGRIAHALQEKNGSLPLLSRVSLLELQTYLQNVLLRDADQMSMAHALEVREPFMDHELIEFVLGVRDADKYPHTPKKLLVDSLGDLLPPEIVNRPKMGFTLPWEMWMRNELRSFCADRMQRLGRRTIFRKEAVDERWQRFLKGDPRMNWSRIWSLVVLEDWLERHAIDV